MTTFTQRRAARVILVDELGRVLLFHGYDPARPGHHYWFTPGGGLEPDETPARGAVRELAEETGLRVTPDQLGEPVWTEMVEFTFDGCWYRQNQDYFLLRVPVWTVDTRGFTELERDSVDAHRWWSLTELTGTDQRFYPVELPRLLAGALEGVSRC